LIINGEQVLSLDLDASLLNLPSEFRKFIRTEPPIVTIFEYTESIYTIDGNIVRDTWVVKTKSDDVIAEINEGINQQKAMILQGLKDYIQTKIDSVSLLNKELDNKLAEIDTNITEITQEIELVDNNINVIKKKTNEKVDAVDHYDNAELNQFFTSRYGN
jgi:archaellum component FlaC